MFDDGLTLYCRSLKIATMFTGCDRKTLLHHLNHGTKYRGGKCPRFTIDELCVK